MRRFKAGVKRNRQHGKHAFAYEKVTQFTPVMSYFLEKYMKACYTIAANPISWVERCLHCQPGSRVCGAYSLGRKDHPRSLRTSWYFCTATLAIDRVFLEVLVLAGHDELSECHAWLHGFSTLGLGGRERPSWWTKVGIEKTLRGLSTSARKLRDLTCQ